MLKYGHSLALILVWLIVSLDANAQRNAPGHPTDGNYIAEWLVLGPFFSDDLETDFLKDEVNIDPNEGDFIVTTKGDTLRWKQYQSSQDYVDLIDAIGDFENAAAYAFCTLESEKEGKVKFILGSNDGVSLWINGEQVHNNPTYRWLTIDEDVFDVDFPRGKNRCLIKVSQYVGSWSFSMRAIPSSSTTLVRPRFMLSSDDLNNGIEVSEGLWKYQPGDSEDWSNSTFDDTNWEIVRPGLQQIKPPIRGWNGIGWFRLHLTVDSTLFSRPIALNAIQLGAASEVYLDGELVAQFGIVGSSQLDEEGYITASREFLPSPRAIAFNKAKHVLAVRYSNFHFTANYPKQWQGFGIVLNDLDSAVTKNAAQRRANTNIQMIITIVPIVFAVLHLILFLFYRDSKENLYYSLFTLMLGVSLFFACQVGFSIETELDQMILFSKLTQAIITFALIAGLRFSYAIFYPRLPRQFWIFLIIGFAWAAWHWTHFLEFWEFGTLLILIMLLEMLRVSVAAIHKKKDGAWIIGTGFIVFAIGFTGGILSQIGILPDNFSLMNFLYLFGLFGLLLAMSVFLARNISRTEIDNARKTMELEEARKLQLSMLPDSIPAHPDLEIAVYMHTATEVGGDYYDFKLHDDGTLTTVIGDATGHGMQAGTIVSATKSLFHALAGEPAPVQFLKKGTHAIKAMGLKKMYMALTIARFHNHHMHVAAAGMPFPLIYRSSTGEIEGVELKGMPLGSFENFPYKDKRLQLHEGDTVLLMSDGFEELFNPQDEMLGEEQTKMLFKETAMNSPEEIIEHLKRAGDDWANGRPHEDDMTFVVIRIK